MDTAISGLRRPIFRDKVLTNVAERSVDIEFAGRRYSFEIEPQQMTSVEALIENLNGKALTIEALGRASPRIAEQIPHLLEQLSQLRLLVDLDPERDRGLVSGAQLYREVRRLAGRVTGAAAKSSFHRALVDGRATAGQLIGYALEYYWIVKAAPGLIGPALATAVSARERSLLQDFLRSELGHDRFLGRALQAVGVSEAAMEAHQPLSTTFSLCASLGVYARQHPLSFKAVLFLFEQAQPAFIDAFDVRCRAIDLPRAFYEPLRDHAHLNETYHHDDISRDLMSLETVVDCEAATVVKRHVALMIETMALQEEQILSFYADRVAVVPPLAQGAC